MIEAGIFDKDLILVRQQNTAKNGDIVVALIEDFATVKTFYKEKDFIRLQPENSSMSPIIVKDVAILGKGHREESLFDAHLGKHRCEFLLYGLGCHHATSIGEHIGALELHCGPLVHIGAWHFGLLDEGSEDAFNLVGQSLFHSVASHLFHRVEEVFQIELSVGRGAYSHHSQYGYD